VTDLETRLRAIIDASLFTPVGENEITPESSFREDMGADSIDIASIAMAVEDELRVVLTDDEVATAMGEGTFGKLLALVEGKVAAKREAA
jgi:acyl carrier protein